MTADERAAVTALADALLAKIDEITEAAMGQNREVVPELFVSDDPAYQDSQRRGSDAALREMLSALSRGEEAPRDIPEVGRREAVMIARLGIGPEPIELGYGEFSRVVWEQAIHTAQEAIDDPVLRVAALSAVSDFLFDWVENSVPKMAAIWERENRIRWTDAERRRTALIQEIVAGKRPPPTAIEGYPLDAARHVCVIVWGEDPQRAVARLGVSHPDRRLEMLGLGNEIWAWLLVDDAVAAELSTLAVPSGARMAIGGIETGREGFRRTALQAQEAYEVGVLDSDPLIRYDEVALVALALEDSEHAEEFVAGELGALAGDDPRSALLRETLRAYFSSGENAAAAGVRIGVHDRTIAYRLQAIERGLLKGRSIHGRRDELDLALRLHRLLRQRGGDAEGSA